MQKEGEKMPVFTAKCDSASDKSEDFNKITRNKEAAETCREPRRTQLPHMMRKLNRVTM